MPPASQPTNAADYTHGYEDCANDVSIALLELQMTTARGMHMHIFAVKDFIERFNAVRKARFIK